MNKKFIFGALSVVVVTVVAFGAYYFSLSDYKQCLLTHKSDSYVVDTWEYVQYQRPVCWEESRKEGIITFSIEDETFPPIRISLESGEAPESGCVTDTICMDFYDMFYAYEMSSFEQPLTVHTGEWSPRWLRENYPSSAIILDNLVEISQYSFSLLPVSEDEFSRDLFNDELAQPETLDSITDVFMSFPYGFMSHFDEASRESILDNPEEYNLILDDANRYLSFEKQDSQWGEFVFKVFTLDSGEWLVAYSQMSCPGHCKQSAGFYSFSEGEWTDVSSQYLEQLEVEYQGETGVGELYYSFFQDDMSVVLKYQDSELAGFDWGGSSFIQGE